MIRIELNEMLEILDSVDGGGYGFKDLYFELATEMAEETGTVPVADIFTILHDDYDEIEITLEIATQNTYIYQVTDKLLELYPGVIDEIITGIPEEAYLDEERTPCKIYQFPKKSQIVQDFFART